MRLIDADKIVYTWQVDADGQEHDGVTLQSVIKKMPTIELEMNTGEWVKPTGVMPPEYHGHYECSECGFWAMRDWRKPWRGVVLTNYCPNCGTYMKGDVAWKN